MADTRVEVLRVAQAPRELREHGMLAWLRVRIGDIVVDGLSLRESPGGALALSYPERSDTAHRRHAVVRPADDEARRAIEAQVLAALGEVAP